MRLRSGEMTSRWQGSSSSARQPTGRCGRTRRFMWKRTQVTDGGKSVSNPDSTAGEYALASIEQARNSRRRAPRSTGSGPIAGTPRRYDEWGRSAQRVGAEWVEAVLPFFKKLEARHGFRTASCTGREGQILFYAGCFPELAGTRHRRGRGGFSNSGFGLLETRTDEFTEGYYPLAI